MNISILLPYKENYSKKIAGAVSLFVNDIILENDPVVYDVKCSRSLEDVIKSVKGIPVLSKTGHSHIKNKMYETKSKVGGEMSGHIFFSHRFFARISVAFWIDFGMFFEPFGL